MIPDKYKNNWPECYLHVSEARSGEEWIMPLRGNSILDLKKQIKNWLKKEFSGEFVLDGNIMPRLKGDYYAKIMTDNRPPDSAVCWQGGGFYLTHWETKNHFN
jgi:hypothetical protein